MRFKGIKGNDRAIVFLKSAVISGRVSHAYVFSGPEGVGKKLAANAFASALNCANPKEGEACGACDSCLKIDKKNHPDVFLIAPEKDSISVKIDAIRVMINNVSLKSREGGKKVYIIDEAHAMTQEAENALLKTLEEPVSDSVMILVTDKPQLLFSTIISRSQSVKFRVLSQNDVTSIIAQKFKTDASKAKQAAAISGGSAAIAARLMEKGSLDKRSAVINSITKEGLFSLDFDAAGREELKDYLAIMLTWYRDMLVTKAAAGTEMDLINADRKSRINEEAKSIDFAQIDNAIKNIINTISFLEMNANPKLAMSVLGVDICTK